MNDDDDDNVRNKIDKSNVIFLQKSPELISERCDFLKMRKQKKSHL